MWCTPPVQNAELVCATENVVDVYTRHYDWYHAVVCFDEKSNQLVGENRKPIAACLGPVERYDNEYVRNGTANFFTMVEPLYG